MRQANLEVTREAMNGLFRSHRAHGDGECSGDEEDSEELGPIPADIQRLSSNSLISTPSNSLNLGLLNGYVWFELSTVLDFCILL